MQPRATELGKVPSVVGIIARGCVRPWDLYTSVRRDGYRLQAATRDEELGKIPSVVEIRARVCVCDAGEMYTSVRRDVYRFQAAHKVAGVAGTYACTLIQEGAARSENISTEDAGFRAEAAKCLPTVNSSPAQAHDHA